MEETDNLSSGNDGVYTTEIGVPGIPFAWIFSLSLPSSKVPIGPSTTIFSVNLSPISKRKELWHTVKVWHLKVISYTIRSTLGNITQKITQNILPQMSSEYYQFAILDAISTFVQHFFKN